MPATPRSPTPAVQQTIVAYIRAGGFPHVAAEAAGVPRTVFMTWLRRGEKPKAAAHYRAFYEAVLQARAEARMRAEIAAFKNRPLDWLRSGPGKEKPDNPGWTGNVKAATGQGPGDAMLQPWMQQLVASLLGVLAPYPEARAALASALAEQADLDGD
jgi:hypothetical protein